MPLTAGTRLGGCEIVAAIGVSGMGEVIAPRARPRRRQPGPSPHLRVWQGDAFDLALSQPTPEEVAHYDKFVVAAVGAGAGYLVTGDHDLLEMASWLFYGRNKPRSFR